MEDSLTVDPSTDFNLDVLKPAQFSLNSHYWTPTEEGESKRMIFMEYGTEVHQRQDSEGTIELEVAIFVELHNGKRRKVSNGGKRLISTLKNNDIQSGTPLLVTYEGKVKNKTNAFFCDEFDVTPLGRPE